MELFRRPLWSIREHLQVHIIAGVAAEHIWLKQRPLIAKELLLVTQPPFMSL